VDRLRPLALPLTALVGVVAGSNVAVQYPINERLAWGGFARRLSL
jgi:hypothetical protein